MDETENLEADNSCDLIVVATVVFGCSHADEPTLPVPANAQAGDLTVASCTLDFAEVSTEDSASLILSIERSCVLSAPRIFMKT
ncbi:MAG: hypothetical protein KDE53_40265 [Caldilineaceae bacterium]|nr:hypothetical protein [Caldilineaceae bacterium]MCB0123626.1 hypothetical protein [Caldilineaceae bacterium]